MRIPLILDMIADTVPDRLAVDGKSGALTYGQIRARARSLARYLVEARHSDGPYAGLANVGYLGTNGPALPVVLFGAAYAGVPLCPLNYRLPDHDLRRLVERLAPAIVVAEEGMAPRLAGIKGVEIVQSESLADMPDSAEWCPPNEGSRVAVLLFTSGTTGEPKAALLRHENLTSYILQSVEFLAADEDEATLVSVPPYHIASISSFLSSFYAGRRMIQLESFDACDWVESVEQFAVTNAMVVPTMLGRILEVIRDRKTESLPLPSLRALAYGGGRMPTTVIRRALNRLPHVAFTNAYGLTETSSTIALLGPEDHALARAGDPVALERLGSVGKPLPGVTIEVRRPDGSRCDPGQYGEIHVSGDQVSGQYVGGERTGDASWFATRDGGRFDGDGYLYIEGRLDDVIVRGGENISPGEIEDLLRTHPAVSDIAVIGVPDENWGEKIAAFVVRRPDADVQDCELQDFVRVRLRSTKTPEEIHFVDELPYNETGKLLRRKLRDDVLG